MIRILLTIFALALGAAPASAQLHALCKAAMDGDTALIAEILDAGAPIDECYTSITPLMFAAEYGQVAAVALLLDRGADPARRDINNDRALLRAAAKGHADVIELLLAAGEPADSPLDPYGISPLHEAALWGHARAVSVLLAAGANPHNRDQTDDTPLHAATTYGYPEVVHLLLEAGGDPNAAEEIFKRTPVHQASYDDAAASLRLLLDAGGEIEKRERDGRTPLHLAAGAGAVEPMRLLVERGANADAEDDDGISAFAAMARSRAFAERIADYEETAAILVGAVGNVDGAFAEAVWMGFNGAAMTLASRGAVATGEDSFGRSALAGAAAKGTPATLELALALGASVSADGGEALAAAAFAGREDSAKRLLELGVPVDARTESARTPLQLAAMEAHVGVAALLIERGADRNPIDADGRSIEALMAIRRAVVQDEIDAAGMSAALIPTEHLEEELARLDRNHAAILVLLGR